MPLIVSPPALEPFLFIVSLAVAGLVVMTAWLRRSHLRQHHMLLVYLLLTFSLSLAVVALTDFSNFSLSGREADTQTGRFLAGLLSFSLMSLIAVRQMRNYPLACCWWFVLVAAYTSLPASSLEYVAQQYLDAITMISLLYAAALFLLLCRFKRNLNDHQYLSLLATLVVFIWVVLTTDETCSASEVIIAGLRPYLPVYTVGDTTCGKPYLMYALPFGKFELHPVGTHVYTSQGETTYTNGIKADIKAADDLSRELGDPQERMLKTALQVLKSGAIHY